MSGYEVLIPIFAMLSSAAVLISFFYLSYKNKKHVQETIRMSIEKEAELNPEILEKFLVTTSPRVKDLRRGVVLASLGLASVIVGAILPDPDATHGFVALGMFPFMIGAGFLLVWKLNRYKD